MKLFIATDIHGSAYYANKVVEQFKQTNAEQLILLGDVYNHGPRNPFPKDYAPAKVADSLNAVADKTVAVQGNCDSEVDQMISAFPFVAEHIITLESGVRLYFTHGHIYNKSNVPHWLKPGDVMFYGHFHISEITLVNGVACINVGSTSLPKDGKNAYCTVTDNEVAVYGFTDDVIARIKI